MYVRNEKNKNRLYLCYKFLNLDVNIKNMDLEKVKTELFSIMDQKIEMIHSRIKSNGNVQAEVTGKNYNDFKSELKQTINILIDRHKIEFHNSEESNRFLHDLLPTIENLITKYFVVSI